MIYEYFNSKILITKLYTSIIGFKWTVGAAGEPKILCVNIFMYFGGKEKGRQVIQYLFFLITIFTGTVQIKIIITCELSNENKRITCVALSTII